MSEGVCDINRSTVIKREFATIINKYSLENNSNTPDYLLAEYLWNCLMNYEGVVMKRG